MIIDKAHYEEMKFQWEKGTNKIRKDKTRRQDKTGQKKRSFYE